jgi:hypothetical protein
MRNDRILIGVLCGILGEPPGPISCQSLFLPTRAPLKSSVEFQQMTGHAVPLILNRLHVGARRIRVMTILARHLKRVFLRSQKTGLEMHRVVQLNGGRVAHFRPIVETATNNLTILSHGNGKFRMIRRKGSYALPSLQNNVHPPGGRPQIGMALKAEAVVNAREGRSPFVLLVTVAATRRESFIGVMPGCGMTGYAGAVGHLSPEPPAPIN